MATQETTRPPAGERFDPAKPAAIVINDRFGGLGKFCRLTGVAMRSARDWLVKGYIPPLRRDGGPCQTHILQVAKANQIQMDPADFVERLADGQ